MQLRPLSSNGLVYCVYIYMCACGTFLMRFTNLFLITAFEDMLQGSRKEIEQLFRTGEKSYLTLPHLSVYWVMCRQHSGGGEGSDGGEGCECECGGGCRCEYVGWCACVFLYGCDGDSNLIAEFEGKFPQSRRMLETLAKEGTMYNTVYTPSKHTLVRRQLLVVHGNSGIFLVR